MNRTRALVGIPTLNGPDRLYRALAAIAEHTDFGHFDVRVLVADDGSTPEMLKMNKDAVHAFAREVPGVEMLYGHGRTGIARTWNRIVRHDRERREVVALVNDDVEVARDWLDVLAFSVTENPWIGMVGLNTYCQATRAQSLLQARTDYAEAHLLDGDGALLASHGPIFAFQREAFDKAGGFDERYFVFYEELDFGVTLRKLGYRHAMASYPVCYHLGGATNTDPKNLDAARCLVESRTKFKEKWGKTVDDLRREFFESVDDFVAGGRRKREWCTQLKVWRDE